MNISHFAYSLRVLIGRSAAKHPETYIYSCFAVGMLIGITFCAAMGWWIGSLFQFAEIGRTVGLGFYGYWFIYNLPVIKTGVEYQIQVIKELREQV